MQHTIKTPTSISGTEFHTGSQSTIALLPAPANSGIIFRSGGYSARAIIENVGQSHRSTTSIQVGPTIVSTVEHLLSAFFGLGISNIYIDIIKGAEIPILDGSAKPWVDLILQAGLKEEKFALIHPKEIRKSIHFIEGESEYMLVPGDNFEVTVEIDFPNTVIGQQRIHYVHSADNYCRDVASARTFIGDGASGQKLDRMKILGRLKSVDINHPETCPCVLYEKMNYITPLRFDSEPVTHKLLDFLGDFSLLGDRLNCSILAKKPSHKSNLSLVKELESKFF